MKTKVEDLIKKFEDEDYIIRICNYSDDFYSVKKGIGLVLDELKYNVLKDNS